MKRLKTIFYVVYSAYCFVLFFLCFKLLQVPDATEDAFYLYLKKTFGGMFGVITFIETYLRSFQFFVVFAVIISFTILASDLIGSFFLHRKISKLEGEVTSLKAKLYDKKEDAKPTEPGSASLSALKGK